MKTTIDTHDKYKESNDEFNLASAIILIILLILFVGASFYYTIP